MKKVVIKKFNVKGKYYLNDGGAGKVKTHKYRVFNTKISKKLEKLGVPKGSKTISKYLVPKWIINNKKFAKEFVKIAYLCEGSMKENRKNPRIKINMNKSEEFLENGLNFMEQLRKILKNNGIKTTKIGIYQAKTRGDGIKVRELRFRVITEDNHKFISEIGWLK